MAGPASVEDYRKLARRRLPRMVFDYVEGGAESERGLGAIWTPSRNYAFAHLVAVQAVR